MNNAMKFASATSIGRDLDKLTAELAAALRASLDGAAVDLMILFLSASFTRVAHVVANQLSQEFAPRVLLACTTEGVIGSTEEIENENGVSVIAAHLPNVTLAPFVLPPEAWEETAENETAFRMTVDPPPDTKLILMLADPYSMPMDQVLHAFNHYFPNLPLIGGMASAGNMAGANMLVLNRLVLRNGAVGVALAGDFEADIIVSQGCRPIGQPYHVTQAERNLMYELDDAPALERIREMVNDLSDEERDLLDNGLMVGRAVNVTQESLGRGDFLVRGVLGIDRSSGAVAIGDYISDQEIVQFHVRDQMTALEDLELMLLPQMFTTPPKGALLFSCNGRGTRLYDHPNGDIEIVQKVLGNIALAGFFCAGEIGPIGGKNFLHGHTASMVIFR